MDKDKLIIEAMEHLADAIDNARIEIEYFSREISNTKFSESIEISLCNFHKVLKQIKDIK
jgi:hypothetical protein